MFRNMSYHAIRQLYCHVYYKRSLVQPNVIEKKIVISFVSIMYTRVDKYHRYYVIRQWLLLKYNHIPNVSENSLIFGPNVDATFLCVDNHTLISVSGSSEWWYYHRSKINPISYHFDESDDSSHSDTIRCQFHIFSLFCNPIAWPKFSIILRMGEISLACLSMECMSCQTSRHHLPSYKLFSPVSTTLMRKLIKSKRKSLFQRSSVLR